MMNVIRTSKMKRTDRSFSSGGINNDDNAYNNEGDKGGSNSNNNDNYKDN